MTTQCPTCERDNFDSEKGMKTHHKIEHGVSIAGELAECEYCGESHRYEPSMGKTGRFCSNQCKFAHWEEHGRDEDVVEKIAESRSGVALSDEHYERLSEQFKGRDITWGDKISDALTDVSRPDLQGENNPNWNDDYQGKYGTSWSKQLRREIRKRDSHCCQNCGVHQSQLDYNLDSLDVHHIQPIDSFDDPKNGNVKGNLISLCRRCHALIEKGEIECPKPMVEA